MPLNETAEDKMSRLMKSPDALEQYQANEYQDITPEQKNKIDLDEYIKRFAELNPGIIRSAVADVPNEKPMSALDRLKNLSTTLRIEEMEKNLDNDCYVFDGVALAGQITLLYAQPNTGKTLLFMYFLITAFKAGVIRPEDVFYINADDDYKGLLTKTRVAKEYGFQMISPAEAGMQSKEIVQMLINMAEAGEAKGKIIILDTVKKFVNLMSKQDQSSFHNSLRILIAKNSSVIMAGHANKYPNAEGNLVYEGTSDTMNDVDCVYSINRMSPLDADEIIIEFRNEKNRGDVVKKVSYKYDNSEGVHWLDRLKSVSQLDSSEARSFRVEKIKQDKINSYESEVLFMRAILEGGQLNQSEITKKHKECQKDESDNLHALATEFSRNNLTSALKQLDGIVWKVTRELSHNASKYELIDKDGNRYERAKSGY